MYDIVLQVLVIVFYDCLIERRQRRVFESTQRLNKLMDSLFPTDVRQRLYDQSDDKNKSKTLGIETAPKLQLKRLIAADTNKNDRNRAMPQSNAAIGSEPIADLFPQASICFADIKGFSAWSSEREPSQVFTLLETVYGGIDRIAKKVGVFKVETVGDCYVGTFLLAAVVEKILWISSFTHNDPFDLSSYSCYRNSRSL